MSLSTPGLVAALADGRFHTGDELGLMFGVSKAAIWKAIKKLTELNLDVHSVRGKGYRLSEMLTLLDSSRILARLPQSRRGQLGGLEILHTIDSTNSHALRRIQNRELDLSEGRCWVCFSESQSAGRGRRGREWVSPFGHNLYMSLVREFSNGAAALDGLSLVVGLALVTALDEQGYKGLQLKWPNDVLLNGQKLAGILLEVSGDVTGLCHVVIGIGLNLSTNNTMMRNVNQPWVALDTVGYQCRQRNELAGVILNKLLVALQMFEHAGFAPFIKKWQDYDVALGKELELSTATSKVRGRGLGVNPSGALLLDTAEGIRAFHGGEVSLRVNSSASNAKGGGQDAA